MPTLGQQRMPAMPQIPGIPKANVSRPAATLTSAPVPPPPVKVPPPDLPPLPPTPPTPLTAGARVIAPGRPNTQAPLTPPLNTNAVVMPPLPRIPWMAKRNPSTKVVQDLYVATRLEEMEINSKPMRDKAYNELCDYLSKKLKRKIPFKELHRAYRAIEQNLQSADLTINFEAASWFTEENNYDTYSQMYERATHGGVMHLKSVGTNNAAIRAKVDNQVTFPTSWSDAQAAKDAQQASPEFSRGQPGVRGGLSPVRQGGDRIMRQMDTGQLTPAPSTTGVAYYATEKYFNPRTKQIFMGLNYGRRRHGSTILYGMSYLVCKKDLKPKCLYYCQDTFARNGSPDRAERLQYSYDNLGAILGDLLGHFLRTDIIASCYEGKSLADRTEGVPEQATLLEAHHFGELRFRDHIEYMAICSKDVPDMKLWPQIVDNATKFCNRFGIPLYLRSA